jgi:hypothetical protein
VPDIVKGLGQSLASVTTSVCLAAALAKTLDLVHVLATCRSAQRSTAVDGLTSVKALPGTLRSVHEALVRHAKQTTRCPAVGARRCKRSARSFGGATSPTGFHAALSLIMYRYRAFLVLHNTQIAERTTEPVL